MRCFLRKMLVFLPLIGLAAQPTVPKSGGLCFRFDDNQTVPKWKDMAEVFRRNNCRFSMSIISHWIHSPEFSALLRNLQKEGHEIMDHTASHAVFTLPARTPEERREFESSPDFDHWNGRQGVLPRDSGQVEIFQADPGGVLRKSCGGASGGSRERVETDLVFVCPCAEEGVSVFPEGKGAASPQFLE